MKSKYEWVPDARLDSSGAHHKYEYGRLEMGEAIVLASSLQHFLHPKCDSELADATQAATPNEQKQKEREDEEAAVGCCNDS